MEMITYLNIGNTYLFNSISIIIFSLLFLHILKLNSHVTEIHNTQTINRDTKSGRPFVAMATGRLSGKWKLPVTGRESNKKENKPAYVDLQMRPTPTPLNPGRLARLRRSDSKRGFWILRTNYPTSSGMLNGRGIRKRKTEVSEWLNCF